MLDAIMLRNQIRLEFENRPGQNEIDDAINAIIKGIGVDVPINKVIESVTGDETYPISSMSAANDFDAIKDMSEANDYALIQYMGRFLNDWIFDSSGMYLIIPSNVIDIHRVYIDDEEWDPVDYTYIIDDDLASEEWFCQYDRKIYFPIDFSAVTNTSVIEVELSRLKDLINENNEINLPDIYGQYLRYGAITILGVRERNIISKDSQKRCNDEYKRLERRLFGMPAYLEGAAKINVDLTDEIY